jgi:hypothetical protein
MTFQEAQKKGRSITIKTTSIILGMLVLLLLIGETKGDFANGILFFLAGIINPISVIYLIILYGLTFILGTRAVTEIKKKNKSSISITIINALIISLITAFYFTLWAYVRMTKDGSQTNAQNLKSTIIRLFISTLLFELVIWLWSTNKIKKLNIEG